RPPRRSNPRGADRLSRAARGRARGGRAMTTQAQPTRRMPAQPTRTRTRRLHAACPLALALALVAALAAACDGRDDAPSSENGETSAARNDSEQGPAGTVTVRRTGPADGGGGQGGAQGAAGSGQGGQSTSGSPSSGDASTAGDVSRQAAANVEATIELGTFSPTTPPSESDLQGRLPAPGDLTVFVPNTNLFPGSARLDP